MSYAKLFVKGEDRDLGYFHFVASPRIGDLIAIKVNDLPTTFSVEGVVHMPVTSELFGLGDAAPSLHLIIAFFPAPTHD